MPVVANSPQSASIWKASKMVKMFLPMPVSAFSISIYSIRTQEPILFLSCPIILGVVNLRHKKNQVNNFHLIQHLTESKYAKKVFQS